MLLEALEAHKGLCISGEKLASELGVSRNAIWKAARALADEGYPLQSAPRRGYCLPADCSVLSAASVGRHLRHAEVDVEFHDEIDSTNNRCKALGEAGAPEGTLVVADCQSAGRGRQGRPFFSPAGTGVYFSLLLRPTFTLEDVTLITTYAAVCTAHAIDDVCGTEVQVKWVNDLFAHGSKICGILTEASFDAESASVAYVVVGIGINVFDPRSDAPEGSGAKPRSLLGPGADHDDIRARIVAGAVDCFLDGYASIPQRPHLEEYRYRSLLDGREVRIESREGAYTATVLGIDDDFALRVQLPDGSTRRLLHGEVHIPSSQLQE